MSERDTAPAGHPEGLAPEVHNDEQDEIGEQAQDVAEDARDADNFTSSPTESTKVESGGYDPAPDSKGDLVDEMRRMEGDGRIDMSAFAGEPNHDDEPETYGGVTTDDDDTEWLTADGETLTEEEFEALDTDLLDMDDLEDEDELDDEDLEDGDDDL